MSVFGQVINSSLVNKINGFATLTPEQVALKNYEKKVDLIEGELTEWQERRYEDELAKNQLLDQKLNTTSSFIDLQTIEDTVTSSLINMKKMLESQWDDFANTYMTSAFYIGADTEAIEDQIIEMMMQPILDAVDPLMNLLPELGLPEIPIIGDLGQILQTFIAIGRLMYEFPQDIVQPAKEEAQEDTNEKTTNIKGKIANTVEDIYHLVVFAFQQIQNIIPIIGLIALLKFIDLVKPVLDAFQLVASTIVNALTIAKTVGEVMLGNLNALLIRLKKYFHRKIMMLVYLLELLYRDGDGKLPVDKLILQAQKDILSCDAMISCITGRLTIEELDFSNSRLALNKENLEEALKQKTDLTTNPFHMSNGKVSAMPVKPEEIEQIKQRIQEIDTTIAENSELSKTLKEVNYSALILDTPKATIGSTIKSALTTNMAATKVKPEEIEKYVDYWISKDPGPYTMENMEKAFLSANAEATKQRKEEMAAAVQHGIAQGANMAGGKIGGAIGNL